MGPSDWKAQPLRALLVDDTPGFWGESPTGNGDIAVIRSTNLRNDGRLDLSDIALRNFPERKRAQKRLEVGDILLERSGGGPQQPVGRVALFEAQGEFAFSNFMQRLRPNASNVFSRFLYYALWDLHARGETSRLQQATTGIRNLRYDEYLGRSLPVPPLPEQRKIAAILSSVDETIEKTEAVIAQLDVVRKAMLEELLTRGIPGRHSRFKMTEIGEVPEEWQTKSLDSLSAPGTDICYGVVQPGPEVPGGVLLIRGGDFPDGRLTPALLRTISAELSRQFQRTLLRGGEVLVALVGKPGACAVVPSDLAGANVARQAAVIRPASVIRAQFLRLFLSSPAGQRGMLGHQVGSVQQVINIRDIKKVLVAVPSLEEQDAICEPLLDCEARASAERDTLEAMQRVKLALSASLLNGSLRVPA